MTDSGGTICAMRAPPEKAGDLRKVGIHIHDLTNIFYQSHSYNSLIDMNAPVRESSSTVANGRTAASGSRSTTQLVLGSMCRADEYQQVLTSLKESAASDMKVQGEMIDRVLDNG